MSVQAVQYTRYVSWLRCEIKTNFSKQRLRSRMVSNSLTSVAPTLRNDLELLLPIASKQKSNSEQKGLFGIYLWPSGVAGNARNGQYSGFTLTAGIVPDSHQAPKIFVICVLYSRYWRPLRFQKCSDRRDPS